MRAVNNDVEFLGLDIKNYKVIELEVDDDEKIVCINYILVREEHRGHFRALLSAIERRGYKAKIFHPLTRTRKIISAIGYAPYDSEYWMLRKYLRC